MTLKNGENHWKQKITQKSRKKSKFFDVVLKIVLLIKYLVICYMFAKSKPVENSGATNIANFAIKSGPRLGLRVVCDATRRLAAPKKRSLRCFFQIVMAWQRKLVMCYCQKIKRQLRPTDPHTESHLHVAAQDSTTNNPKSNDWHQAAIIQTVS